jgi:hypothetical protein
MNLYGKSIAKNKQSRHVENNVIYDVKDAVRSVPQGFLIIYIKILIYYQKLYSVLMKK